MLVIGEIEFLVLVSEVFLVVADVETAKVLLKLLRKEGTCKVTRKIPLM